MVKISHFNQVFIPVLPKETFCYLAQNLKGNLFFFQNQQVYPQSIKTVDLFATVDRFLG